MQFCHYKGAQQQSPFQTYSWNIIFFFTYFPDEVNLNLN